jgi:hypothetical protein
MVLWDNVVWNIALTDPVMVDDISGGSGWCDSGRGERVHTPHVAEDLASMRTKRPQSVMVTAVLVKILEQPWSHSWPMERSELDCREGKMCAKRAELGRPSILSNPVCVLEMVTPSRRMTEIMSVTMVRASRVLEVLKKWPVAPVSITVVEFVGREGVDCMGVMLPLVMVKLSAVGMGVTGPLDQERQEVREGPVCGFGMELVVFTPIMLVAVAAT